MERPEHQKLDDEGLPLPPRAEGRAARWLLTIMERGETVLFIAIALALLVIAVVVFVHGVHDLLLAPAQQEFAVTVTPSGPKPICRSYSTYSGTGRVPPSMTMSRTAAVSR